MRAAEEKAGQATARELERRRPGWMIIWGVYSRTFVAFPLFRVRRRGIIVVAAYPDALLARMEAAERRWRLPPPGVR
jgi:hypothetical protein